MIDYANQRLKEMMGNKKLIEINSKVFKEIKNYLDDKEKNVGFKVNLFHYSAIEGLITLN